MKAKELKQKTKDELVLLLREDREKLRLLRFDLAAKKLKKTDGPGKVKKEIARVLTILKIEASKR